MLDGIVELARSRLRNSPYPALRGVGCVDRDGALELRGDLPSYYLKQVAQALVMSVEGVTAVANRITVSNPHSDLGRGPR